MDGNLKDQIIEIASEVFFISKTEISLDSKVGELNNWDSLGHLNLILAIEGRFGVKFSANEIIKIKSINDILKKLEN